MQKHVDCDKSDFHLWKPSQWGLRLRVPRGVCDGGMVGQKRVREREKQENCV